MGRKEEIRPWIAKTIAFAEVASELTIRAVEAMESMAKSLELIARIEKDRYL